MIRTALAAACVVGALSLGIVAAPMAGAQADPLAELCAATGIEQVDAVLTDLDAEALEGPLAPLLTLTVPQTEGGFALRADVTSNDVREALDCAPTESEPTEPETTEPETPAEPTVSPATDRDCTDFATQTDAQIAYTTVTTTETPDPLRLDADGDGIACEVTEGPTGGGSDTLDPVDDDGSIADIDGDQVTVVPEGSAQTGGQ